MKDTLGGNDGDGTPSAAAGREEVGVVVRTPASKRARVEREDGAGADTVLAASASARQGDSP